jgi:hypothetical protein
VREGAFSKRKKIRFPSLKKRGRGDFKMKGNHSPVIKGELSGQRFIDSRKFFRKGVDILNNGVAYISKHFFNIFGSFLVYGNAERIDP